MSSNEKVINALGDRKEAVGTTILTDKKSLTKNAEKVIEELADTLLYKKQYSKKYVNKGADELADTFFLRRNTQQRMYILLILI